MSTIKSSSADLTLNADGSGNDISFQSNASQVGSLTAEGDFKLVTDASVLGFGVDNDVTLTHVHDTGLLLSSTDQLQFGDSGTYIHQSADGVLDLVSDTELELNATTIDINGAVEIDGTTTMTAETALKLLRANDETSKIKFADPDDDDVGMIHYNHSNNSMNFRVNGTSAVMAIASDQTIYMGSDGSDSMSMGTNLHVKNNHDDGYAVTMYNEGNRDTRHGLAISCGYNNASGTNRSIDFYDGDHTLQGSITFQQGTVSYGAFTANHDVELPNADNDAGYDYGTLVEITELFYKTQKDGTDFERGIRYKVQKSSSAYSKSVLGAYASKYSVTARDAGTSNLHQVYVLGDGHILCNREKGNIAIGDGICASATAGVGMKADKTAMIIGIAQEAVTFSNDTPKLVAVQYGLQQFTPWE